ncbi:MAG: hypothetical protein QOJ60_10 [Actinomycetota bacterium]|jgi:hypothetical protein|nr:hypothetical protein [Actinomycetota bacterium]
MTSVAVPSSAVARRSGAVRQLARIEAQRYARHPLFLVGFVLALVFSAGEHGPTELDYHVIPSFFIGVLGIVVAARLTASTRDTRPVLDSAPVTRSTQTAALCLACAVPGLAALVTVLVHRGFVLADPLPEFHYGTYGATDRFLITIVVPVIACIGAPLLGVAVGRWLRFPGAGLLAVVGVIFWSNIAAYVPAQSMDAATLPARALHMFTPYTAFGSSNGDANVATTVLRSYTGSVLWFTVWTVMLCALAATAAMWRGTDGRERRKLQRVFVVLAVAALVSFGLAVRFGNDRMYDTTPSGTSVVTDVHAHGF